MIVNNSRRIILSIVFVVFLLFLYGFRVDLYPSGFQNDEASFLLNSILLKETGFDEVGQHFPIYLKSFIDPKPALYSYLQIPFIFLLGETVTAARLPSVIFGVSSVIILYLFFANIMAKRQAYLATLLLAISPWYIVIARSTQEAIMSFFFSVASVYLLNRYLNKKRFLWAILSFISVILAMYSYHSAKVVLPLLLISQTYLSLNVPFKEKLIRTASVLVLAMLAMVLTTFTFSGGLTRFKAVSIFSDQSTQLVLDEQIRVATPYIPALVIRTFHNKIVNYSREILFRYSEHFSFNFLYLNGGQPKRYIVPAHGLLYLVELPFLVYGIYLAIKNGKSKNIRVHIFMTLWLLAAPLADSITSQEHPSIIRTCLMLIPISYFASLGLESIIFNKKHFRHLAIVPVFLAYLFSIAYFSNQFLVQAKAYHPWSRNKADEDMINELIPMFDQYDHIYISNKVSGQPYVYLALKRLIPFSELQSNSMLKNQPNFTYGKVTFVSSDCAMDARPSNLAAHPKDLFISNIYCKESINYSKIATASYEDGVEAYAFHTSVETEATVAKSNQ